MFSRLVDFFVDKPRSQAYELSDKNIKTVQRTRRENVTEMVLEAIEAAHKLEHTTESYYLAAAEKIKALSEMSHALKTIAKKHTTHLMQLSEVNL